MLELVTGAIVALAAVALVLEPLLRRTPQWKSAVSADILHEVFELEESESPKVKALLALREIEFDRATGKLSDDDYSTLKRRYEEEALAAIKEEDRAAAAAIVTSTDVADPAEEAVRRIRNNRAECPHCGVRPEPAAVYCSDCGRSLHADRPLPRCWMCGAELDNEAQFCGQCGYALSA